MILYKVFNSWCIVDLNKYEVSAMYGQQNDSFVLAEGDQYFFFRPYVFKSEEHYGLGEGMRVGTESETVLI